MKVQVTHTDDVSTYYTASPVYHWVSVGGLWAEEGNHSQSPVLC